MIKSYFIVTTFYIVFYLVFNTLLSDFLIAFPADYIVKLTSQVCDRSWSSKGSGILFKRNNQTFVVTSSHVVLPSQKNVCNTISSPKFGNDLIVILRVADWSRGLALLQLVHEVDREFIPSMDAFQSSLSSTPPASYILAGFPHHSDRLLTYPSAKVVMNKSDRHLLPMAGHIIEVVGHGEFGMSGGGLISELDKKIRVHGLISHQYIKIILGKPTQIHVFSQSIRSENHLLIISASDIKAWLHQFFAKPSQLKIHFNKNAQDIIQGRDIVYTGGLAFELKKISIDGLSAIGTQGEFDAAATNNGHSPAGVGGHDPIGGGKFNSFGSTDSIRWGIGGHDPIGAAGGEDLNGDQSGNSSDYHNHEIIVSLDKTNQGGSWYDKNSQEWALSLKKKLHTHNKLRIPFFVYQQKPVLFRSLEMFFTRLKQEGMHAAISFPRGVNGPFNSSHKQIAKHADDLSKFTKQILNILRTENQPNRQKIGAWSESWSDAEADQNKSIIETLNRLDFFANPLINQNSLLVEISTLEKIERNDVFWTRLFNNDEIFEHAVNLNAALLGLIEALKRVQL